jgi:hypothetical protein
LPSQAGRRPRRHRRCKIVVATLRCM